MVKLKGIQIAVAAVLLTALSAPAFAEQEPNCMRKIGVCDRGEEHKQPERARSVGAESPSEGEQPEGEQPSTEPSVE